VCYFARVEKVKLLRQYRNIRKELRFSQGTLYDSRQEPWLALEKLLEVPGYRYCIDKDGDLAREPRGQPWTPPASSALPTAPLSAFADVPALATQRFAQIPYGSITYYESELLEPDHALALWEEASARARETGLAPVIRTTQVQQHELKNKWGIDYLGVEQIPANRQKAAQLDVSAYFAEREARMDEVLADCIDDDEAEARSGEQQRAEQAAGLARLSAEELAPVAPRPFVFQRAGAYVVLVLVACVPWELPACIGVGGWNQAPTSAEQSAVLRHWSQRYGGELVAIGDSGYMEHRTLRTLTPPELKTLAWEMFLFCEDVVLQGTYTVAALAKELASGHWYLWWD
jgi:hypothetical protein